MLIQLEVATRLTGSAEDRKREREIRREREMERPATLVNRKLKRKQEEEDLSAGRRRYFIQATYYDRDR